MPRWEVCRIHERVEVQRGGWKSGSVYAHQAELFTPSGDSVIVAESDRWQAAEDRGNERNAQLNALIARLGHDGWEPMPLITVSGSGGGVSSSVGWYFKRQLPDA